MKIWQLKIKNLGPFHVKPVELDFQNGILADASLLAITGRTGAGKTMLFDAVCVALYGKTPRLDGIEDRHPRHLLSHNKSDGHAEVIFETNGIRYLAEWSIKRGGVPGRQLIRVGTGDKIADGGQVTEEITAILGLDFDAFRRSIMLAQGDFAAFLKAPPARKLEILEATAGIGIYDELRVALHEKMNEVRDEKDAVQLKKDEVQLKLDAMPKVSRKQVSCAKKTLRDLEEKARTLTAAEFDIRQAQDRFSQAAACIPERKKLDEQIATLSNQLTEDGARQTELKEQIQTAVKFIAENPLPVDREERLRLRDLAVLVDPIKELRRKLKDDEPCLVCGAMEHPHAHEIASEREPAPDLPLWNAIPDDLRGPGVTLGEAFAQLVERINAVEEREKERDTKQNQLEWLDSAIETTRRELERAQEQRKSVHANIERYQREGNAFLAAASEKTGGLTTEAGIRAALPIRAKLKKIEKAINDAQRAIGAQQANLERLKDDLAKRERLEKALCNASKALCNASDEFTRWNKLRMKIAHPIPKALGIFALRVVLEQVSQFANTQLEFLTSGRYQLKDRVIRDFSGIKLSVIDRWNANEERPVETLSGGESFLTSFALALGLSEISRGRAEIGSLFLDEGFGTLDAETLDIVIDALERLRLQGRSIFLISHIEKLTRHLPVEIRVQKRRNAGSTVDVG